MNHEIEVKIKEMGLRIESKFIPFSQSRNKDEKFPSLNWVVTLYQNDRKILSTDYVAGSGHCPSYKQNDKSMAHHEQILRECEKGFTTVYGALGVIEQRNKPILPDIKDVLYSLLMDSDALDYEFSDWCANFGYDDDSIHAKDIYDQCISIGLQMVRVLGQNNLQQLREVYQDY